MPGTARLVICCSVLSVFEDYVSGGNRFLGSATCSGKVGSSLPKQLLWKKPEWWACLKACPELTQEMMVSGYGQAVDGVYCVTFYRIAEKKYGSHDLGTSDAGIIFIRHAESEITSVSDFLCS